MRITRGAGGIGTDYWLVSIANGQAFASSVSIGGVVGAYSQCTIFNPAASTKTVRVKYAISSASTAGTVGVYSNTADPGFAAQTIVNLKVNGPAGSAKYEGGTSAAIAGTLFMSFDMPALQSFSLNPGWVIECPPGTGILVLFSTQNVLFKVAMAWIEV